MIEIIPNWHPVFVHFTVALLSLTVVFHLIHSFVSQGILKQQFYILANWNLWLGTGFGIITAIAGWFAYNSVAHDAPSHVAMTEHRNLALVTLGLFILLTAWSMWQKRQERLPSKLFLIVLLIGGGLLSSTAWHGAEAVYRYGLGVMSLPKAEGDGHNHSHGGAETQTHNESAHVMHEQPTEMHDDSHATHQHDHASEHDHGSTEPENAESDLQTESEAVESTQARETENAHDHSGHEH